MSDDIVKPDELVEEEPFDVPDPNGPPRAVKLQRGVSGCLTPVIAGGGLAALIFYSMLPCVGATRSAKLEWQRREHLIDVAEQESRQPDNPEAESDAPASDDERS